MKDILNQNSHWLNNCEILRYNHVLIFKIN